MLRWICLLLLVVAAAEQCSNPQEQQPPLGTIVYFPNTRGRAEVIRLLLSANNMTWKEEHNLVKEDAGTPQLPFGQWPLWKQDDDVLDTPLAQTDAITRHIGRLVGWYGISPVEDARIDQVLGGVESLRGKYSALVYGETYDLQAYIGLHVDVLGVKQRNGGAHFQYLENLLRDDDKDWAVGTKPSIADAQVFDIFDMHLHLLSESNLAMLFPKLMKHHAKFASLPGVAAYLKSFYYFFYAQDEHTTQPNKTMLQLLLHSFATKAASPPPRKTVALSSMSIITESIKRCKSVTDIDKLILQTPQSDFTGICCAMAIGKLGQYKSQNVESLNKMLSVAEHHTTFNARSLSSTLHGLAIGRLVSRVPDFLMTRLVDAKFEEFTPQDYATVLWSLAKLEHKHEAVLAKMSKRIMEDDLQGDYLQRFNSQDLANSLWAFATLRYKNEDLYDTLLGELETRKLTKFQSQELVNIMWAFAKVNHTCGDEFAEAVVDEICERDNAQFTPQGISNLLWAYQRLGHSHLRIADKFIQEIVKPTFRVLGK